jgi:DNA-binding response OmpR family regulator
MDMICESASGGHFRAPGSTTGCRPAAHQAARYPFPVILTLQPVDAAREALVLDLRSRRAMRLGHELQLGPHKFEILSILAANLGSVVELDRILAFMWGERDDGGPLWARSQISIQVSGLRPRIKSLGLAIVTRWGVGFHLEAA